ncbi:MAG: Luciferase-like monooxygenase [Sphingomonadales bacterium]|nr:Luciferase-like monooxygenase [Sphingomonadales bacterium]
MTVQQAAIVADTPATRKPLSPADIPGSPLAEAFKQPMMLGLFLDLQDTQRSEHPTSTTWNFDYNAAIVQRADALGFELAFSRTQWLPKGGYDGEASLDSFIALGAMAPLTKRIMLISTLHVLYGPLHPLHIAKFGATFDHIAKGRWGINIVTGHRAIEHQMFGWQQIEHDQRYALASELVDVVDRLWVEDENYSYDGISPWKLDNAYITPKPLFGRPVWVNATGSEAGIAFAARHSDIVFVTSPGGSHIEAAIESLPAHVAKIRAAAQAAGRQVRIVINPTIVSGKTDAEAKEYAAAIIAGKRTAEQIGRQNYSSDAHAWAGRKNGTARAGPGVGGNVEIIGGPAEVVDWLIKLKQVGIDGIQIGFYDFDKDLDIFAEHILPLMKQSGLRL